MNDRIVQRSRLGDLTLVIAGTAIAAAPTWGGPPPIGVQRVVYQGQVVSYNKQDITIGALNAPFVDGNGQVGLVGSTSAPTTTDRFIWHGSGITFLASEDIGNTLSGAEGTMGVSNTAGFIYSPTFNGLDAVYTHNGKLLAEQDVIPGGVLFSSFNSRPVMLPNGTAFWVCGETATAGGASTGRQFLRATDTSDPTTITRIFGSTDVIGGRTVNASGVGFQYNVSDNALHMMNAVVFTAPTASDAAVTRDGAIVAQEASASPDGSTWVAPGEMAINNCGNWVLAGDTSAATTMDEILVYNGALAVREGDVIDGVTLPTGSLVIDVAINNLGRVMHIWDLGTPDVIFVGYGPTLAASSKRILGIGDSVDYTGDSVADATLTDLEVSSTISLARSLPDDDFLYVEATLTDLIGGAVYEAILKVPLPELNPCPADTDDSGDVDVDDLIAVILGWGDCLTGCAQGCAGDTNASGAVDVDDLVAVVLGWGPCP